MNQDVKLRAAGVPVLHNPATGVTAGWISADGRTVHLVFSGDDHFSVRQATIRTTSSN